ncbi:hypothetical protein L5515_002984 [Caenorhabditis briggsae]|uniref:RING-type domain-containing protein n=2 Tax=Caenorhabditis briggsae TaxID=6238 RepID=A0AAE9JAW7_CAEBR|nr:hypothetical protein L5515_002984 [Caenorhabditis briggsae]
MVHKVVFIVSIFLNVILSIFLIYNNFDKIRVYTHAREVTKLTLFSAWIFYTFCAIFKGAFTAVDRQNVVPKLEKVRRDIITGYGLITMLAIVPSFLVVLVRDSPLIIYPFVFISNFSSIFIFLFFIVAHFDNYSILHKPLKFKAIITLVQLALSLIASLLTWTFSTTENASTVFYITIWYTVFFSAGIAEFFAILRFGVKIKYGEEDRVGVYEQREIGGKIDYRPPGTTTSSARRTTMASMVRAQNPESAMEVSIFNEIEDVPQNHTSYIKISQCKICTQEYNGTVIPRILITCGHTVCEVCINNLLDENHSVVCPFCRKSTSVPDGQPDLLPKNFAILEMD